jgi:hypothetical protein
MQPSHDQQYSNTRTEDPFGTWAHPSYEPAAPGPMVTRGRPWIVALTAFLTLLVLIAALGNQWVTDSINRHANGDTFIDHIVTAITTYQWRFSPRGGHDVARVWASQFALIGTVLVLTFLLVGTVCRGKGGFAQAFFASWMTVLAGTLIGGYVKAAVIDRSLLLRTPRLDTGNAIFFSPLSPGTSEIVGGLEFGFCVAVVAGVAAVMARRREPIAGPAAAPGAAYAAPYQAPDQPPYAAPEHYGQAQQDQAGQPVPAPVPAASPWSYDDRSGTETQHEHTAVLPPVEQPRGEGGGHGTEATTQLPRGEGGESETEATTQLPRGEGGEPEAETEATTQLPRTEPDAASEPPPGPQESSQETSQEAPQETRQEAPQEAAEEAPQEAPQEAEHTAELPRTEPDTAPSDGDEQIQRPPGS